MPNFSCLPFPPTPLLDGLHKDEMLYLTSYAKNPQRYHSSVTATRTDIILYSAGVRAAAPIRAFRSHTSSHPVCDYTCRSRSRYPLGARPLCLFRRACPDRPLDCDRIRIGGI